MLRVRVAALWRVALVVAGGVFFNSLAPAQAATVCIESAVNYAEPDVGAVCSAIVADPNSSKAARIEALIVRGIWHDKAGRLQDAKRDYEQGLALAPDHAKLIALRAGVHYLEGELKEARAMAEKSVQIDPASSNTFTLLASIARQSGDLRGALGYSNKAIEINPENARARYDRANILIWMGRPREALADIEWLTAQPPAVLDKRGEIWFEGVTISYTLASHLIFAQVLRALDRYEEAEAAYNKIVADEPSGLTLTMRSKFLHGLPIGAGMRNRLQEALADAKRAVRLAPASAMAQLQLSSTLEYSGHATEALEALDCALRLEDDVSMRPPMLWRRARLLRTMGRAHEAEETGRESLLLGQELNHHFLLDRLARLKVMGYWLEPASVEQVGAAVADAVKACMADEKCW
jgi:tetratricopeptide (TPR) repeat protein